jgi:DNA-binding LytR/AlgR family response regulator
MRQYLFFKTTRYYHKIKLSEILYVQAENKFASIVTTTEAHFVLHSFKEIEGLLPEPLFNKVHRSYIISLEHTEKFDNDFVYIGQQKIPIAESYRSILKKTVVGYNTHDKLVKLETRDDQRILKKIS